MEPVRRIPTRKGVKISFISNKISKCPFYEIFIAFFRTLAYTNGER